MIKRRPWPRNQRYAIRHSLKTFGIRFNGAGRGGFARRSAKLLPATALVAELIDAMLCACRPSERVLPAETW